MRLFVKAPAKINLALDVLRKREDGFHDVKMVMTTIDLADRLDMEETASDVIRVSTSAGFLPEDERNLAYRAAQLMKERFQIRSGVSISIDKQIPVAAGLAGGSTDAAAVLRGLNRLWDLGISTDELAALGSEIGSDVAFCVHGGTAVATGRGEIISPISAAPPCWVVLAKPEAGVSTKDIYEGIDTEHVNHPDVNAVIRAVQSNDYRALCRNLGNVFEEVTIRRVPEVRQIKQSMANFGADGVLMSGSGPTVFGLTRMEPKARRIVNGLRGFCQNVYMVRMLGSDALE
ncbi:MAG TPA: 4-(cytidine 5'-diphospho)-2-C-methyl-D-erythritol kinase [Bacillales bacterium]|nr:4-(cytidine 5'-diphospho)-2-C-methyl-D-erythritol kinase [Bacillales bacterium]